MSVWCWSRAGVAHQMSSRAKPGTARRASKDSTMQEHEGESCTHCPATVPLPLTSSPFTSSCHLERSREAHSAAPAESRDPRKSTNPACRWATLRVPWAHRRRPHPHSPSPLVKAAPRSRADPVPPWFSHRPAIERTQCLAGSPTALRPSGPGAWLVRRARLRSVIQAQAALRRPGAAQRERRRGLRGCLPGAESARRATRL